MDAGIGADRHHRAIAEMDLAGAAHQKIEAERRRRPDQPGKQIGDQIKPVDQERRGEQKRNHDADQKPVERQRPQLALVTIIQVTDAGTPVEHHTLSICS